MSYKRRIFRNEVITRFLEDDGGIYIIQKNNEIVFIGESYNLRQDILDRLSALQGAQIKLSFYSNNGKAFNPSVKAEELLQKYRVSYGKRPEFNENSLVVDAFLLN